MSLHTTTRPNLFIVGAPKAGTTSLYEYLRRHPDVFMSPRKEPHYFSGITPNPKLRVDFTPIRDDRAYLELFRDATTERLIGEASPSYLWSEQAARRIKEFSPDARIIILLRDPVQRAFSQYLHGRMRDRTEERTFEEAIDDELASRGGNYFERLYIALGRYCEQVSRYLELFADNVLVLFYEEFFGDFQVQIRTVHTFLQIADDPAPEDAFGVHENAFSRPRNKVAWELLGSTQLRVVARSIVPARLRPRIRQALLTKGTKPVLDASTLDFLRTFFDDDVDCLERLLGRTVPWPRAH